MNIWQVSKADRVIAVAAFCAHYHEGQWSRKYQILSTLTAVLGGDWLGSAERTIERYPDDPLTLLYRHLEKTCA